MSIDIDNIPPVTQDKRISSVVVKMMHLRIFILLVIFTPAYAEKTIIEALYKHSNTSGSMIIESADKSVTHRYNVNDNEGFVPASTFKIANTLIMLEERMIKGPFDTIEWDGKERAHPPWNKNQTLTSAFRQSCVWCYQRYAIKIGDKKYRAYLQEFEYGNQLTGSDVTRFWLDGELRVSLKDQINFLRKVHTETLPVKTRHIATLKSIMLSEDNAAYKIWSKTGWSGKDGWYVGYLTSKNQTWFFAHHMEILKSSDLAFRKKLIMKAMRTLDIIPQEKGIED